MGNRKKCEIEYDGKTYSNPSLCADGCRAEEQLQRQSEDAETKIKHLYCCRLHTSDYTGSYGAMLGMSDSGMYLDENLSQADWYPTPLYSDLDKDMGGNNEAPSTNLYTETGELVKFTDKD